MILKPLSLDDMETVRGWRNSVLETLRTPYMLTREMQEDYYRKVICDRNSTTRYWGFWEISPDNFIGYGGIEHIEWENSRGEISVLINPDYRRIGYGVKAVQLILDQAFNYMNLFSVHAEVYTCANYGFWQKMADKYCDGQGVLLPCTKYYNGAYWDSYYHTFFKEAFNGMAIGNRNNAI